MDTVETLKLADTISREYEERSNTSQTFNVTGEEMVGNNHWRAAGSRSSLSPSAPRAVSGAVASPPINSSSPRLDVRRGSMPHIMDLAEQRSSSPPKITGIDGLQRCSPPPPPPTDAMSYSSPTNSPQQTRHRKTFLTEFMERSIPPLTQARRSKSKLNPSKSAKDSSLFRLIVTLQLCLIRIEEANSILCDGQACAADRISNIISGRSRSDSFQRRSSSDLVTFKRSSSENSSVFSLRSNQANNSSWRTRPLLALTIGVGGIAMLTRRSDDREGQLQVLKTTGKVAATMTVASFIRKRWRIICMKERIANSADALEDWIFKWICLVNDNKGPANGAGAKLLTHRRLNSFWYSNGSLRIQLIKRGMDLLYASIGKAIEITRERHNDRTGEMEKSSGLWTYVVASVAASYYNVIGPAAKSAQVTSSSSTSIIQGAWGMVSLRAVKMVSLEATRILKGAAIAGRIEICGVSCFVLSRSEFPVLASALRRFHRQQEREDVRLGTIHEKLSSNPSSANVTGFQSKNVIFHLTGGGFFAHTIAGDLPYLLDWSAATDSVVIIPEYALLPHHKFPDAMQEIKRIYTSLRFDHAVSLLGFRPDKIIVTGESVGGNLASALCVSLILDHHYGQYSERNRLACVEQISGRDKEAEDEGELAANVAQKCGNGGLGLPDALMLCCPALNFSSDDTSQSRIHGAHDPVLPSGLLAVISSSYVQNESDRNNPLVSPFFATDATLKQFPSTMIFTGSEDPVLDDSVTFNARLRSLGVKSYLRAVNDMPHAFWALSTAGIGLDVQKECQEWLRKSFYKSI